MELLPIGSIVILKNGFKKLMIIGRKILQGKNEELYDYLGCLYPEGDIGEQYKFIFNHEDIDKLLFKGYEDEEEMAFRKILENKENI